MKKIHWNCERFIIVCELRDKADLLQGSFDWMNCFVYCVYLRKKETRTSIFTLLQNRMCYVRYFQHDVFILNFTTSRSFFSSAVFCSNGNVRYVCELIKPGQICMKPALKIIVRTCLLMSSVMWYLCPFTVMQREWMSFLQEV